MLENAITSKTKAIVPVSLYGIPSDFDAINKIASRYSIPVIEEQPKVLVVNIKILSPAIYQRLLAQVFSLPNLWVVMVMEVQFSRPILNLQNW